MITNRIAATIAAAALGGGVLLGAAGAVVVRDAANPWTGTAAEAHMSQMNGAAMMNGAGMMTGAGMTPAQHGLHHPGTSPASTPSATR
jgi:hypothetical protein